MASNFHQPPKKDSRPKEVSSGGRSGKAARDKKPVAGEKTPTIGRAEGRRGVVKNIRAKGSATKGSRAIKPSDTPAATDTGKPAASGKPSRSARAAAKAAAAKRDYPKQASTGDRAPAKSDGRARTGAPKSDGRARTGGAPKSGGRARTGGPARSGGAPKSGSGGTSKAMNAAAAAGNPGSYLNNCRMRALSVCTRRELGQQPRDVLVQLAIAHPVKTMRLGAIRQLTAGNSPREVAALRLVERSIEAGPEVRAAASRGADIVQHRVDDL
jgi:hypothetical protein